MNRSTLFEILARYGLIIDCQRIGTGSKNLGAFYDIEIGTGKPVAVLASARDAIKAAGHSDVIVDRVDNPDHEQFGKRFLHVRSCWIA
jgi:hypothetical protein